MARPFDDLDFRISKTFSVTDIDVPEMTLTNDCLFDFASFIGSTDQNVTIPDVSVLPRFDWPIGCYGVFNNLTANTITFTPAPGVTLNEQSGPVVISDGSTFFYTPAFLVRVSDNNWRIYIPPPNGGGGGNVTGTGPTVVSGLATFNNLDGTGIQGQTNITATTGTSDAVLAFNAQAAPEFSNAAVSFYANGGFTLLGAVGFTSNEFILSSETLLDIAAPNGIQYSSLLHTFNKNAGDDSTPILSMDLNTSTFSQQDIFIGNNDPNSPGILPNNVGDKYIRADNTTNSGEYFNFDGLPTTWVKSLLGLTTATANALALWTDNETINEIPQITSDGQFINFDQALVTSDIGIRYRDTGSVNLTQFYWDESNVRQHLDTTGNFDIDAGVQCNFAAGAEFTLSAGLSLSMTHGNGALIGTATSNLYSLGLFNPNQRADIYVYDQPPDGLLTAEFGGSYCFVRGSADSADDGLYYLDTALNNQNTPWTQIASVSHSQTGMFYGGTVPVTNLGLMVFNGTSGTNVNQVSGITALNAQMIFTARNAADVNGIHWQDENGAPTLATLYQNSGNNNLELTIFDGQLTAISTEGFSYSASTGDADRVFQWGSTGTNGANVEVHFGTRNPKNNITPAGLGDLYIRAAASTSNSNLFVADDFTNTGWTALKGGGIYVWGNNGVNSGTTTRFLDVSYNSNQGAGTNEDNVRLYIATGGHFRDFRVTHGEPAGNGNLIEYTFAVNGVTDGSTTVTLASTGLSAGNTSFVKVNRGDYITIHVTKVSSVGSSPNGIKYEASFFPDGS